MDKITAFAMGFAFRLGKISYAVRHGMAMDEAKWITIHPNGKGVNRNGEDIKGIPLLIESSTGEILGGGAKAMRGTKVNKISGTMKKAKSGNNSFTSATPIPATTTSVTSATEPAVSKYGIFKGTKVRKEGTLVYSEKYQTKYKRDSFPERKDYDNLKEGEITFYKKAYLVQDEQGTGETVLRFLTPGFGFKNIKIGDTSTLTDPKNFLLNGVVTVKDKEGNTSKQWAVLDDRANGGYLAIPFTSINNKTGEVSSLDPNGVVQEYFGIMKADLYAKNKKNFKQAPVSNEPPKEWHANPPVNQHIDIKQSSVYKCLGQDEYNDVRVSIKNGDSKAVTVFDRYEKDITLLDKHSTENRYILGQGIECEITRYNARPSDVPEAYDGAFVKYRVFCHEVGHNIDWLANNNMFSSEYKNGIFQKTIKQEIKAHLRKLKTNGSINPNEDFRREILGIKNAALFPFSDIVDGATDSKIKKLPARHGALYWKNNPNALAHETFAHMFSLKLLAKDSFDSILRKYLPKSTAIFDEMLEILGGSK